MLRVWLIGLVLAVPLPGWAQQLTLEFADGAVTLTATNVPVRQILDEWARVGGTRFVGVERVSAPSLTMSLEGVPEAQALDLILRDVAGYVAVGRPVSDARSSGYDRIMVLATSTPARAAVATSQPGGQTPAGNAMPAGGMTPDAALKARLAEPADAAEPFHDGNEQPALASLLSESNTASLGTAEPSGLAEISIPFGPPVPEVGQPYLQDRSILGSLPPADPGPHQPQRPRLPQDNH